MNKVWSSKMNTAAENYAQLTAVKATAALLFEVAATPKPGLVDRHNTGAHTDMDIALFQKSSLTVAPYFYEFVRYGTENSDKAPGTLLADSRHIGIEAEAAMLQATQGVNTHKGAVFSLGIMCMACGWIEGRHEAGHGPEEPGLSLQQVCAQIARPAMKDFDGVTMENARTAGQRLYAKYGITGVRGEAAAGFPAVFACSLPRMRELQQKGFNLNDAGILCLVDIMGRLIDTNVIHRSSYEAAEEIRARMQKLREGEIEKQKLCADTGRTGSGIYHETYQPRGQCRPACHDLFSLFYGAAFGKLPGMTSCFFVI